MTTKRFIETVEFIYYTLTDKDITSCTEHKLTCESVNKEVTIPNI